MSRSRTNVRLARLTPEQKAQLPLIRDKWISIGLNTDPADRARAEHGIRLAYRCAKLGEPSTIIWLQSPLAGAMACAVVAHRASFRNRVWTSVEARVGARIRASIDDSIRASIGASVWASVWASIEDSIGASIDDSIRASWASVLDAGYGQHDASWIGFYDAFSQFGLSDLTAPLNGLAILAETSGWYWPFRGLCILTDRPYYLARDERGRLHAEDRAAVEYRDGWGVYVWHGTRVPEAVILSPQSLTVEHIQAEVNTEIRRVMLERFGLNRYIHEIGALPIHADDCGTLYRCEQRNDEPLAVVSLLNSTAEYDGSRKTYMLRVPPNVQTAHEAVAWSFGRQGKDYQPTQET